MERLLDGGSFTDVNGHTRPLTPADILVVAPYNMQVRCIRERLTYADQEDQLTGTPEFLRDVSGIRWRETETQSIGPMSGVYRGIFAAPRSRPAIEREFSALRERLENALVEIARSAVIG